jgi:hypothetical protein
MLNATAPFNGNDENYGSNPEETAGGNEDYTNRDEDTEESEFGLGSSFVRLDNVDTMSSPKDSGPISLSSFVGGLVILFTAKTVVWMQIHRAHVYVPLIIF